MLHPTPAQENLRRPPLVKSPPQAEGTEGAGECMSTWRCPIGWCSFELESSRYMISATAHVVSGRRQ